MCCWTTRKTASEKSKSELLLALDLDRGLSMWIKLLSGVALLAIVAADRLKVEYQWKQIDFKYPSVEERQAAITSMNFIQENVIPVGLEVHKNRLFITLPRWKKGVPASLAYIDLEGE